MRFVLINSVVDWHLPLCHTAAVVEQAREPRRRDPTSTRRAILDAARQMMAELEAAPSAGDARET
jgi:hypothetical protein